MKVGIAADHAVAVLKSPGNQGVLRPELKTS